MHTNWFQAVQKCPTLSVYRGQQNMLNICIIFCPYREQEDQRKYLYRHIKSISLFNLWRKNVAQSSNFRNDLTSILLVKVLPIPCLFKPQIVWLPNEVCDSVDRNFVLVHPSVAFAKRSVNTILPQARRQVHWKHNILISHTS